MRGYVPLLLFVAGIWGASFMFIKIAVDDIDPIPMMALRLLLAAGVLVPFLMLRRGVRPALGDLRAAGVGLVVLGVINNALPFTLIAWGEEHVDSSVAAIANAPVPLFVALLAIRFRESERASGMRLVGIVLGFVGVGVLAGFHPEGGWWAVAGTLAIVAAALSYAASNLYAQGRYGETSPLVIVAGSTLVGALTLVPPALFRLPEETPDAGALASVVALGILGTAVALLFYFRMLVLYGAARSSLVTYLIPPIAVVYGVAFLDESLHANSILGLVLILGGVALGSGVFKTVRRRQPVPATPRS